jgi:two-component system, OmpR family, response regulator
MPVDAETPVDAAMIVSPALPTIAMFAHSATAGRFIFAEAVATGWRVAVLPDPISALAAWHGASFDVAIIDAYAGALPPADYIATARAIARNRPLLVLTDRECSGQRTFALVHGADDAIDRAGDPREIMARAQALARRHLASRSRLLCDDLEIDLIRREVSRAGRAIVMPLREFDLLTRLARNADQIVSRTDLFREVWRLNINPGTNRIEVHVSRLRQRIDAGHSHAMLRTIKGSGYALVSRAGASAFAGAAGAN